MNTEKTNPKQVIKSLNFLILILILNISCSRSENQIEQSVSIQLPNSKSFTAANKNEVSSMMTSGCADITENGNDWNTCHLSLEASEINCFAVMIGGDEPEANTNSCQLGSGSNYSEFTFGKLVGMFPAGSKIELDMKLGKRRIYLLGLYNKNGICEPVSESENGTKLQNKYSRPLLTAKAEVNIVNGPNSVQMINEVLPAGSRSSQILSECKFSRPWQPSDLPFAKDNLYWLDQDGAPDAGTASNWNFNTNYGLASVRSTFQGLAYFTSGNFTRVTDAAGVKAYSFQNTNSNMHKSATQLNNNFAISFVVNLNEVDAEIADEKVIFKMYATASNNNSILRISSQNKKLIAKRPIDSEINPSTTPTNYETIEMLNLNSGVNKVMLTVTADYQNQKYLVYVNNNPNPFSIQARLVNSGSLTLSDYFMFGTPSPSVNYYSFRGNLLADVVLYYSNINLLYHQKMFQYYRQKYPSYLP